MRASESCDLVIVGGGPAGSTLAWALRGTGLKIIVLDRQLFPRDKTCAGWVTPAVFTALDLDVGEYAREHVVQPIRGFRMGSLGAASLNDSAVVNNHGADPISYGIRRCEFDTWLLRRCGAEVREGHGLQSLQRRDSGWLVNGAITAPFIVGAGGYSCPVARALGARPGSGETAVAARELEFELGPEQRAACAVHGDRPEIYFCADLKGYGWAFRKGNWLNIGLGREGGTGLRGHVDAFQDMLIRAGRIPADLPKRYRGHAYLLYEHSPRRVTGDGALLLGDAAGLAYTRSGEGIRPAVESALLAARVIADAGGAPEGQALARYPALLQSRFGQRRKNADAPGPLQTWAARRLLTTRWFTRHVVTERWFLHSHQPPLAPVI